MVTSRVSLLVKYHSLCKGVTSISSGALLPLTNLGPLLDYRFIYSEFRLGQIMSTFMAKAGEIKQSWHLVDAADQVVGRLAVKLARILTGKHRPEYTPHIDTGEFVV